MKRQSFLVLAALLIGGTSLSFAIGALPEVNWHGGESTPSLTWVISPVEPDSTDIISFSGPTDVFSNACYGEREMDGFPTLTIDNDLKTIELWFVPPGPDYCLTVWDPVCGLEGQFGPLAGGEWLFFSDQPETFFYIPFEVIRLRVLIPNGGECMLAGSTQQIIWEDLVSGEGCPGSYRLQYSTDNCQSWGPVHTNFVSHTCSYDWFVPAVDSNQCLIRIVDAVDPHIIDTSDSPFCIYQCLGPIVGDLNEDCYVDFGDFAILAAHWMSEGGTDTNDLARFAQGWCECGNPCDPACGD